MVQPLIGVSPAYFISRFSDRFSADQMAEGLDDVVAIGFDGFQPEVFHREALSDWQQGGAARVAAQANALDLQATQFVAHFMLHAFSNPGRLKTDAALEDIHTVLDIAGHFDGCRIITVPLGAFDAEKNGPPASGLDHFRHFRDKIGRMAETVRTAGFQIALEIMPGAVIGGIDGFMRLNADLGGGLLGLNFDTGHAWVAGEDLLRIPERVGQQILGTHLCDNFGHENLSLCPGTGSIAWPRLLSALAAAGYDGVEIVYPYEVKDPAQTKAILDKFGLNVAAVNVNVKAEPEFRNGGLTSHEPDVRAKAVQFIKDAKNFAAGVGADKVTCCPLGDGYEFSFQYDYATTWKYLVEGFGEAGSYKPEIPLFIEYKPSETRGRCFIDSAAKTLCLLNDIGNHGMGVTLDFGHSIYGNEHPAEAVAMLAESPYQYYIHVNDNDGKWDWDYFCGTKHFLEYVEFLYYLKKYGYNDYLTSDTSPTRWDIRGTFEANSRLSNKIWDKLDDIDGGEIARLMARGDYLATWKFIEENIFALK